MNNRSINSQTRLAAIIGNPVAQSLSPAIHNAAFESLEINWLYLAFLVEPGRVRGALEAMSSLGIAGYSVTMPHKVEVAKIVSEIGEVDEVTLISNSANTVVLRHDGTIFATNTDGQGACNAIESTTRQKIAKSRVVLFGAGGTASAVVYSLINNGADEVVIFNRTQENAEKIARNYDNCRVGQDLRKEVAGAQLIINTTPVGFDPSTNRSSANTRVNNRVNNDSPLSEDLISANHTVLDAVYRPLETNLLRAAKKSGAQIVDGLEMLVHQAALQQQIWLGKCADTQLMRNVALKSQ